MGIISKPVNLSTEANLLYEIYRTLSRIHIVGGSGGSGVQSVTGTLVDNTDPNNPVINTPSFAETLAEDNKTNDIPIVSNNGNGYAYVNDEQTVIGNDFGGTKKITMNEDSFAIETNVRATIDGKGLNLNTTTDGFGLPRLTTTQMNAIAFPTEGMIVRNTTESKIYQFNGTVWEALTSSIPFEIQIKQTTNDEPLIILSGSIHGNRGATITPSLVVNGIYRLTASTDIFKDLKDCYKRTDYYDVNILNFAGYSAIFTWYWYYIDDYTLEVVVTDGLGGSPTAEFLTDYVLLKAEYKN